MGKSKDEYIEVSTSIKNPQYPTRVRIIDFDGRFEHAEAYTPPVYIFSVQVEIKYNKVVDGKEENLITCSFWTTDDSAPFSFEDDDLDEESVDDWFWEGISEDLSFHDLEGLEKLDFYALGVPANKEEEDDNMAFFDDCIFDALDKCIPDHYESINYRCTDLYLKSVDHDPLVEKTREITTGECRTEWSIEDFDYDRDNDDIQASFIVQCSFYVKEELLFSFEYKTRFDYLMKARRHNLYNAIVGKINKADFQELVAAEDMSELCNSYESYDELMEDYDSFEDAIIDYVEREYDCDEYEAIDVTLGDLAKKWEKERTPEMNSINPKRK
jgi:hypothetical protein